MVFSESTRCTVQKLRYSLLCLKTSATRIKPGTVYFYLEIRFNFVLKDLFTLARSYVSQVDLLLQECQLRYMYQASSMPGTCSVHLFFLDLNTLIIPQNKYHVCYCELHNFYYIKCSWNRAWLNVYFI